MLSNRQILYAKTKLMHIRSGSEACPPDVRRKAGLILWTLEKAIHGDRSCEWIADKIRYKSFRENLKNTLSPIVGRELFPLGLLPMSGEYSQILDQNYWTDCAPWWKVGNGGRYGANPGEDILIKLIAGKS